MVYFEVTDVNTFEHMIKNGDGAGTSDDQTLQVLEVLEQNIGTLNKICKYLVHTYAAHYCDTNIWALNKFHSTLKAIEEVKPKEKRVLLCKVIDLFRHLSFRTYASITESVVNQDTIKQWMYGNTYHAHITDRYFSSVLNDETLACMKLLEMLISVGDVQRTMYVLKHVANLAIHTKHQHLFSNVNVNNKDAKDIDLLWIVFELLFLLSPANCKDFVGMARDIYFYKLVKTQKDAKISRLPILFNAANVCVKKRFRKKRFDLEVDAEEDRMDYLYIIPEVDIDLIQRLRSEKDARHTQKFSRKYIAVTCKELERINQLKKNVHIVRKT